MLETTTELISASLRQRLASSPDPTVAPESAEVAVIQDASGGMVPGNPAEPNYR